MLRDELAAHKAARRPRLGDLVFPSANGSRRDRHNMRGRVMAPVVARTPEMLADRDARPLPDGMTPHKLRHTFASLLTALGRDPAFVMGQLGHTDPRFTLRVYANSMRRTDSEREALRALAEGAYVASEAVPFSSGLPAS